MGCGAAAGGLGVTVGDGWKCWQLQQLERKGERKARSIKSMGRHGAWLSAL